MTKSSKTATERELTLILGTLRACYPQRIGEDEWVVTVRRYRQELQRFTAETVFRAADKAWRKYPSWFPTLGQMVELCDLSARELCVLHGAQPEARQLNAPRPWDDEATGKVRAIIDELTKKIDGRSA